MLLGLFSCFVYFVQTDYILSFLSVIVTFGFFRLAEYYRKRESGGGADDEKHTTRIT